MAIDPQRPADKDCFVRKQKIFYPQKLHLGHDQLKHFVNCPHTGQVYLVNQRQIFCIDTHRNQRTHVTDLPFDARCTATGHGWLCVGGGDNGYFASVRIPQGIQDPNRNIRDTLGPGETQNGPRDYWDRFDGAMPPRMKIERLGDQLINSISIHQLHRADGQADVIALVTNNDHSVRIWSLTNEVEMDFETFPFPMNHATISPNGKLLVVVGDQEWAYLYRRHDFTASPSSRDTALHWERLRDLALHKPPGAKHSEYFTTAWSPNGRLLATASQQGYITVFDVNVLEDLASERDPIVALMPSSRASPYPGPGAVRTMCFAPDPWDLLLWTENNGRLGVGDLRTGLTTRQIVDLDPKSTDVRRIELIEANSVTENSDVQSQDGPHSFRSYFGNRRHASGADGAAQSALIRDYNAVLSAQRRQGSDSNSQAAGLTDEEWQRLDMLRTTRQHEEAIRRAIERDTSNVRTLPLPYSARHEADMPPLSRQRGAGVNESTRADEVMDSIRAFNRTYGDSVSAVRTDDTLRQTPRRRRSFLLSSNNAPGPSNEDVDSDPWRTIAAAMTRASAMLPITESDGDNDDDEDDDDFSEPEIPHPERDGPTMPSSSDFTSVILPASQRLPSALGRPPAQLGSQNDGLTLPRPWDRGSPSSANALGADYYMNLLNSERTDRHNALRAQQSQHRVRPADNQLHAASRTAGVQRARDRQQREAGSHVAGSSALTAQLSRQLGRRLGGVGAPETSLRLIVGASDLSWLTSSIGGNAEDGLETTGVAWDEERRVVYAGTVEGVFELAMDFESRKFWPSVQMR